PDNMIKLFVPDGVWDSPGMATCHGHDEIYKFMDDLGKSGRIRNSAHMVMNPEIEIEGDTATGGWRFLMMYTGNAPDGTIQFHRIIGTYEDKFVRTDQGWRFTSLRPLVEETDAYTVEPSKFNQAS
ncbi:MAG: nuclear transport factor 2 family protein, partial [Alphaproteobacteria bacterium]|nr:nuclear transport factor 2 family protein [Alphaproteobacteria bacterium]